VTVDSFLVGAWTRHRLFVDGVRCLHGCQVLWLQTPDWYADIRLPCPLAAVSDGGPEAVFARPSAFAGTASWHPPIMTWQHQLDSMPDQIEEFSPLDVAGDLLVESGRLRWAGLSIPFREEWRRMSGRRDEATTRVDSNRIAITIGGWRIEVEDNRPLGVFRASRHDFEQGSWRLKGTLVEPARSSRRASVAQAVTAGACGGGRPVGPHPP
jgi:hypothetical protein